MVIGRAALLLTALILVLNIEAFPNIATHDASAQQGLNSHKGSSLSNSTNSSSTSVSIAPQNFTLKYTNEPPKLTSDQIQKLQSNMEGADRAEPPSKITNNTIQGPTPGTETKPNMQAVNNTAINASRVSNSSSVVKNFSMRSDPPGDVHVWTNSQVSSGGMTSEPTVAGPKRDITTSTTTTTTQTTITTTSSVSHNLILFYTANWSAGRSIDGGTTWTYWNPYTTTDMRDFCCDQDVIFHNDPNPDNQIFIWYRQASCNAPNTVPCNAPNVNHVNHFRLSISRDAVNWCPHRSNQLLHRPLNSHDNVWT